MSGRGKCYDNASVETVFKTIKAELIWRQNWPTRCQAEAAIFVAREQFSFHAGAGFLGAKSTSWQKRKKSLSQLSRRRKL